MTKQTHYRFSHGRNGAEPVRIWKARNYIDEHVSEELSLTQVAKAAETSANYLSEKFKEAVGINFVKYVARARDERAARLLANADLRVSEIAFAAGFQSLSQFNRVFKKFSGKSPTEYRAQMRKDRRQDPQHAIFRRQNVDRLFRNDFSPAIALFDRDQFFYWGGERRELVDLAHLRPVRSRRRGEKRMQGKAKKRDGERCAHDRSAETKEDAKKRAAINRFAGGETFIRRGCATFARCRRRLHGSALAIKTGTEQRDKRDRSVLKKCAVF